MALQLVMLSARFRDFSHMYYWFKFTIYEVLIVCVCVYVCGFVCLFVISS